MVPHGWSCLLLLSDPLLAGADDCVALYHRSLLRSSVRNPADPGGRLPLHVSGLEKKHVIGQATEGLVADFRQG